MIKVQLDIPKGLFGTQPKTMSLPEAFDVFCSRGGEFQRDTNIAVALGHLTELVLSQVDSKTAMEFLEKVLPADAKIKQL